MAEENKKDDLYWKVLNCALELEFKKGHLKWTITELSRKSQITRSLIYYYFGRSKMDILQAAVSIIGEEFIGMTEERKKLWLDGELEAGLRKSREIYDKMPYLCAFYLSYREQTNEIGDSLKKIEKNFKQKLKQALPGASPEQLNTVFAVYFGVVYSPFVGEKEIRLFTQFMKDIFAQINR